MKIKKLSLQAFGPYVGKETIDFEKGLGADRCFLIHGMTGAGKTTLLDAICFALYGKASGSLRTGAMLRAGKAAPEVDTWVEFVFALGEHTYRVFRSPTYQREDRKSATRAQAELYAVEEDGERLLVTGVSEVTEYIETLTGFRCEQFRQVVLLPQGEFRAFLVSDSKRRGELMQALFHTERYAAIEKKLKEQAAELEARGEKCRTQREQLLAQAEVDSESALAELLRGQERKVAEYKAQEAHLQQQRQTRQKALTEAKALAASFARLTQAEKDCADDARKRPAVEEFRAQLAQAERAAALLDKEQQAAEAKAEALRGKAAAEQAERAAEDARQRAQQAAAQLAAEKAREGEGETLRQRISHLEEAKGIAARVAQLKETYQSAARQAAALKVRRLDEEMAAAQAKQRLDRLRTLERMGRAAALARDLRDGEPCPVCGACEHPQPAVSEDVVPAAQEIQEAESVLEKLQARVRDVQAKEQSAVTAVATQAGRLASERDRLPEGVSPVLQEIEAALAQATAALHALEKRRQDAEEASKQAEKAVSAAAAQGKSSAAQAEAQREKAERLQQQFAAACDAAGFPTHQAYEAALIGKWRDQAHREEVARHIRAFEDAALKHQAAREAAAAETKGQEVPDIPALTAALSAAETSWQQVLTQEKETSARLAQGQRWQAALALLAKEQQELEQSYRVAGRLAQVANGEQPYRIHFQTYIQRSIFHDVMEAANERLSVMSGQRYALALGSQSDGRKADGLEIAVYDAYTGKCREAQSLSGGESFLASLSLALGLADVVERYAGGIRLDTLFIDEGFGSLDSETLDLAIEALLKLQEGGRVIGIISHVEELATRIPCRLEVKKSPEGSTARFLTGALRE